MNIFFRHKSTSCSSNNDKFKSENNYATRIKFNAQHVFLNDISVLALIDTGSEKPIISKDVHIKIGCPILIPFRDMLNGFRQGQINLIGCLDIQILTYN